MTILVLIKMVFVIVLEMFHERISFNSDFLLLLANFGSGSGCSGCIYRSSLVSGQTSFISMVFGCLCYCDSSQKSLRLYQQKKNLNLKFREASNRCKRVLEAAKLAYANARFFSR